MRLGERTNVAVREHRNLECLFDGFDVRPAWGMKSKSGTVSLSRVRARRLRKSRFLSPDDSSVSGACLCRQDVFGTDLWCIFRFHLHRNLVCVER